jgi:hypothetical protein
MLIFNLSIHHLWGQVLTKFKPSSRQILVWSSTSQRHFTPFQKKELVFLPIYRISVIENVFFFQVIQTFTKMSAETCHEGLFTYTIAKRPGINTRMCSYITYSEPGAQTLQFHAHPNPSCFSACSKPQSRWVCMHAHNKAFVR